MSILRDSNGLAIQNKSYFEEEDRERGSYLIDFLKYAIKQSRLLNIRVYLNNKNNNRYIV